MKCKICDSFESKVVDSRQSEDGLKIRRRRECVNCGARFTTYEMVETNSIMIIKNDNTIQPYNRSKILDGLIRACVKRPVSMNMMEEIILKIEKKFYNEMLSEITSKEIGELVLEQLKKYDEIAYIRFASVYRDFKDISTFISELNSLQIN